MGTKISSFKPTDVQAALAKTQRGRRITPVRSRGLVRYRMIPSVPVPVSLLERQRLVGAPGREPLWDRFCTLRSQVLAVMERRGWRSLGITSARPGEGKTWTAVNLAISISRRVGHTALLVDANLRRPAVHRYFDIAKRHGLANYLCDGAPLESLMLHPVVGNLSVVPAGESVADSSDFLASGQMHTLVRDITGRYANRTVLFDMPSVADGDGALAMFPHVDAVLLVVEEGSTNRETLRRAAEALGDTPIIGTVLNKGEDDDA
ncbi:CpsD/CapB family tyrosine-protein kinase [Alkalilimnicola sp. S0819]|uniref:CpsD/CapB family tyrosine-protein kinase n=1 Tax=Alkalilimnicola sp. S0819 TaxID=2613922 RepID=UPI0012619633|nr:CpsD/CapB family tyrosine-protein kinase [Alkalilimnicola sp. S0819]KAB7627876.1 CpsD/CapB family tyrosine-protein kinase [Alkalilimnicola sp. S0819]MPQ15512.1 exopolysaccharide biosynthesis protein [Alkalilimnicola sp. S0819]